MGLLLPVIGVIVFVVAAFFGIVWTFTDILNCQHRAWIREQGGMLDIDEEDVHP